MKNYLLLPLLLCCSLSLTAQQTSDFYFNVFSPAYIYQSHPAGEYGTVADAWGWDGTITNNVIAQLAYAPEGMDNEHWLCEATIVDFTGKIVMIERGGCEFGAKALFAQDNGAVGVLIRSFDEVVVSMATGNFGSQVTIPVIMITQSVGTDLLTGLDNGDPVTVGFTHSPNSFARIDGKVKQDENANCMGDPTENSLEGWKVTAVGASGFSSVTYTGENGNYELFVDTTSYDITLAPPHPIWESCPAVQVTVSEFDSVTIDLQASALQDCAIMSVDIETPLLRRCFDNNNFSVHYCNLGTLPGEAAYITVQFDDLISVVSSSMAYTELADNTFEFVLGDVAGGDCGSFIITTMVSCDADFDQTLCAFANIYPNAPCIPSGAPYTGPSVYVEGACDGSNVAFSISNTGGEDMVSSSTYTVFKDGVLHESGPFQLLANGTTDLSYPADGATYRVEATQVAGYPEETAPGYTIEACVTGGTEFSTSYFNMFSPADYGLSYDEECEPVIGAYDPNDKTPTPLGYGDEHFIEINTDIHYLIRFQNTGTDTAFNVVVLDTLSASFDLTSLDLGPASHAFEFRLLEGSVLEFKFNDIMLPDSNVNEPLSHGFFSYNIAQREDLSLGTVITNSAAIYFDFNEPVITNETFHTIGENFIETTSQVIHLEELVSLQIYPNPMQAFTMFDLEETSFEKAELELYDALGQLLRKQAFEGQQLVLQRNGLLPGVYFYKVHVDGVLGVSGLLEVLGR